MFQKTTFKLNDSAGHSSPSYCGFNFGCAQEPDKDGEIRLVSGLHTCREGLFHQMRSRICDNTDPTTQPTDKMRMIFRWYVNNASSSAEKKKIDEEWAKRSVAVLQAFDKLAGWPLTRVYKLDTGKDWLQAYYYHSSRRWMKSSYLVSLYILLVRMCADTRITGFKDFNGLVKTIKKITDSGPSLKSDQSYVLNSLPYWEAIMKGYPDLFRKHKLPYYWDTSRLGGSVNGGSEGIQYLVNGNTKYTEIRQELMKIKKNLEAKKSK
jgi:hypothetical protein